jgi:hypothetical protein
VRGIISSATLFGVRLVFGMWTGGLRCAATTGYWLATLQVAGMGSAGGKGLPALTDNPLPRGEISPKTFAR